MVYRRINGRADVAFVRLLFVRSTHRLHTPACELVPSLFMPSCLPMSLQPAPESPSP